MNIVNFLKRLGSDNSGATAIEYGLIVSLIVIGSIGAFDVVANENNGLWAIVSSNVTDVLGEQI
jgi:pilus assembly protein Flp/PilA